MTALYPSSRDSSPVYRGPLRHLALSDARSLQETCFPSQSLDQVEDHLRWCLSQTVESRLVCLVAEMRGQAIATGQFSLYGDKGEVGSLIVAPQYRRQGIGTALVRGLIDEARQHSVHILEITARVDLPWIRAWYERLGFRFRREHGFPDERVAILTMDLTQGASL